MVSEAGVGAGRLGIIDAGILGVVSRNNGSNDIHQDVVHSVPNEGCIKCMHIQTFDGHEIILKKHLSVISILKENGELTKLSMFEFDGEVWHGRTVVHSSHFKSQRGKYSGGSPCGIELVCLVEILLTEVLVACAIRSGGSGSGVCGGIGPYDNDHGVGVLHGDGQDRGLVVVCVLVSSQIDFCINGVGAGLCGSPIQGNLYCLFGVDSDTISDGQHIVLTIMQSHGISFLSCCSPV